ncbi:MAG TPA: energy transducer TonB [Gemmatimonadaceae bacterium]
MATHLLESGHHQHRSLGAAIPSIALHSALILAAIHATAHAALKRAPTERAAMVKLHVVAEKPVQHPLRSSTPTAANRRSAAPLATLVGPLPLPSYNPDIQPDAKPVVSRGEFGTGPVIASASGVGAIAQVLSAPEVDRQVVVLPGSPAPLYPEALRAAAVQGTVVAAFVVDTMGRVETGSFRLLEPANELFVAAVKSSLARARFVPAEAHGAKVRQLVEQPFSFVIR